MPAARLSAEPHSTPPTQLGQRQALLAPAAAAALPMTHAEGLGRPAWGRQIHPTGWPTTPA